MKLYNEDCLIGMKRIADSSVATILSIRIKSFCRRIAEAQAKQEQNLFKEDDNNDE